MTPPSGIDTAPSVPSSMGRSKVSISVNDSVKRTLRVVDAEDEKGNCEYKRRVSQSVPARLRSLATQMSFRMDEGNGICMYRVGVEDDGCHSLLDYESVAESARVLELIARGLNAVVRERKVIQNEVDMISNQTATPCKGESVVILESSILGDANGKVATPVDDVRLRKAAFTRIELTIQRIETHLLDASPVSVADLSISDTDDNQNQSPQATTTTAGTADSADVVDNKPNIGETLSTRNIRVAVVGNVDAGKSTLIGTLTTSALDDGRGKSRTAIMKHRHEIESGRTSTATTHLMGFRSTGQPVAGRDQVRGSKRKTEDEVARESHRIITLMDLAGHEKYLKTTIHGVSSGFADYSLILVNSRQPPTHMTQHHLNLCCSFGIPVIVVFTKVDGCPEHAFKTCKEQVTKMLRSPEIGKRPFAVRNPADIDTVIGKLQTLAPMIETSCVSGAGIDLLQKMLFALPKRRRHENKVKRNFEFLVEDIFNVPGVGGVVSGFVNSGKLDVGANCNVYVGPVDDGSFMKTVAKSAHIARINTSQVTAGHSACLALSLSKDMRRRLRRGMVVLQENATSTRMFDAEICVLKGEGTTIRRSYQAYVHILNVRQSAFARNIEIVNMNPAGLPPSHAAAMEEDDQEGSAIVLRPGSRAKVKFEFSQRPEYIRPGMRMLFRDGRVRGVGIVTGVGAEPAPLTVK